MQNTLLALILVILSGVNGECPSEVIDEIQCFWNGNPPNNLSTKLLGTITFVTPPSYFGNETNSISCAQAHVFKKDNGVTVVDIVSFYNSTYHPQREFKFTEKEAGIVDLVEGDKMPDKLYIINIDEAVFSYFKCDASGDNSYKPYGGLGLINVDTNNSSQNGSYEQYEEDLEREFMILSDLGIAPEDKLHIDCKSSPGNYSTE